MSTSTSTPSRIPVSRRSPDDQVIRDGKRYRRCDIDRPIKLVDFIFSTLGGCKYGVDPQFLFKVRPYQYPENTPTQVAAKVVQAAGHVAIADIGCGTANTLLSWGNKIASQTKCGLGKISMTGVSLQDYRGESMHTGTNHALRHDSPPVRYVVSDAKNMTDIEDNSQDVVLAYNSLRYATQPDAWLSEMLRIGKPGGTVLFNSEFEQAKNDQPLTCLLDKLNESGFGIRKVNFMIPEVREDALPTEVQIMLDLTENAVLCRVDIPQN